MLSSLKHLINISLRGLVCTTADAYIKILLCWLTCDPRIVVSKHTMYLYMYLYCKQLGILQHNYVVDCKKWT